MKQKYISKPDRKKLAAKLGLKDSQVRAVSRGPSRQAWSKWEGSQKPFRSQCTDAVRTREDGRGESRLRGGLLIDSHSPCPVSSGLSIDPHPTSARYPKTRREVREGVFGWGWGVKGKCHVASQLALWTGAGKDGGGAPR